MLLQDGSDLPNTMRASVPKVNDAFRPRAKVESVANEFPLVLSSKDVLGSTKGFSAALGEVDISRILVIARAFSSLNRK
jgi:hypothetical protein